MRVPSASASLRVSSWLRNLKLRMMSWTLVENPSSQFSKSARSCCLFARLRRSRRENLEVL